MGSTSSGAAASAGAGWLAGVGGVGKGGERMGESGLPAHGQQGATRARCVTHLLAAAQSA